MFDFLINQYSLESTFSSIDFLIYWLSHQLTFSSIDFLINQLSHQLTLKKFLNMETVQYLRPQLTNWDQNFTMWEGFGHVLRIHDVWGHIYWTVFIFKNILPQTSWNPKIYQWPSHMKKFLSQLVYWDLGYGKASIFKNFQSR